ncbi:hypothetical protein HZH68_012020 [Vespula germanica]|uniref:Uncharacterized protein n=1 Tax=Vespula germanica TaxID=30212 RepID=A0A834JJX6_VESGE|nr:hypothetical protein HZH68_012020 [Vespula germanica]
MRDSQDPPHRWTPSGPLSRSILAEMRKRFRRSRRPSSDLVEEEEEEKEVVVEVEEEEEEEEEGEEEEEANDEETEKERRRDQRGLTSVCGPTSHSLGISTINPYMFECSFYDPRGNVRGSVIDKGTSNSVLVDRKERTRYPDEEEEVEDEEEIGGGKEDRPMEEEGRSVIGIIQVVGQVQRE